MFLKICWKIFLLIALCFHLVALQEETIRHEEESPGLPPEETTTPVEADTTASEETAANLPLEEFRVVSATQGRVKGFLEYSSSGKPFYSFLGIPYAKPPTGKLRFKDPENMGNWEEELDGTVAAPPCSQIDVDSFLRSANAPYLGEEDCLYLNIYTPDPTNTTSELPVLVYIHGGHFTSGSALDYEPYDLLNAPLVLVVLQYRLGVLGFLSTEDLVMPGNLGLKDQTMALRWLHQNVEYFGGSQLKVTLFGSGSGAASVHFQILTHHTIGLFRRGILQSGTALCPWASGGVHKAVAYHIGKHFKCLPEEAETKEGSGEEKDEKIKESSEGSEHENEKEVIPDTEEKIEETAKKDSETDNRESEKKKEEEGEEGKSSNKDNEENKEDKSEEQIQEEMKHENLLQCLQQVDVEELTKSVELFYMWAHLPLLLGPRTDGRYFPESPEFLLLNARHKRLDMIIGINKDDGSYLTNSLLLSEGRRMALKHHFPIVGPVSLEFGDDDVAPLNMSIMAYDKYTGGLNIDTTDAQNITRLFTDRHYGICSDLTADWHSTNNVRQKKNVFFYELHHRGERSRMDGLGLEVGQEWISQGDELFYLFPMNKSKKIVRDEDDTKIRDYMTIMWFLFADTGNPTPNATFNFTWEPYTKDNRQHLRITTTPAMEEDNRKHVREFWSTLPTKQNIFFNPSYFTKLLNKTQEDEETIFEEKDKSINEEENKAGEIKDEL